MLYRSKPPMIEAYQFIEDWEDDIENWPRWLELMYKCEQIIPIKNQRVIAVSGKQAIFLNDYVYINEDGMKVVPEEFFEQRFEAV